MKKTTLSMLLLALGISSCLSPLSLNPPPTSPQRLSRANLNEYRPERAVSTERLQEYVGVLSGHRPRPDGITIPERGSQEGRNLTREYLTATLTDWGYKVERDEYRHNGTNILVHLMASQPTDEYILVGAHLDSVTNAGADDNSSGSAAVLELARVLRELPDRKINLTFAWFDEEELGLVGSKYLARRYRKEKRNLTSVHTLDMVGFDRDQDSAIEIEQPDGELWAYYQAVNQKYKLDFPLYRTSSGSTDHVAFRRQGFKSVGICEEWVHDDTTPYYHRRTDQYNTLNFQFMTHVTQLVAAVVGDLVQATPPPLIYEIVPHHHFPGRERPHHNEYPPQALP